MIYLFLHGLVESLISRKLRSSQDIPVFPGALFFQKKFFSVFFKNHDVLKLFFDIFFLVMKNCPTQKNVGSLV